MSAGLHGIASHASSSGPIWKTISIRHESHGWTRRRPSGYARSTRRPLRFWESVSNTEYDRASERSHMMEPREKVFTRNGCYYRVVVEFEPQDAVMGPYVE